MQKSYHTNLLSAAVLALHLPQNFVPVGPAVDGWAVQQNVHRSSATGAMPPGWKQLHNTGWDITLPPHLPNDDLTPVGAPSSKSRCAVSCTGGGKGAAGMRWSAPSARAAAGDEQNASDCTGLPAALSAGSWQMHGGH